MLRPFVSNWGRQSSEVIGFGRRRFDCDFDDADLVLPLFTQTHPKSPPSKHTHVHRSSLLFSGHSGGQLSGFFGVHPPALSLFSY
jgi:hypothetical protein